MLGNIEYTINNSVPNVFLEMYLKDLLCKHVFEINNSEKATKLLEESGKLGYKWCQWNVYAGKPKCFEYDMGRILKMEEYEYNHSLRIVVCQYPFSKEKYIWTDNLHSTIRYIRKYGFGVKLKKIPFYVVDLTDFSKPTIYARKGHLRENKNDITGAVISAKARHNFSNSKDLVKIGYTVGDFIIDNPAFYDYENKYL